jgi:hypothetical protein
VWPITIAATTGPTPKISVTVVRDAATARSSRRFDAHQAVEVTEIIEMLTRKVVTDLFDRIVRLDAVEELLGGIHRYFLGDSARDELDQQGMEPTRAAISGPAQIPMPFRQQSQHDRVIRALHRLHTRRA